MKVTKKIHLTEKDIKKVISEYFNLDQDSCSVTIIGETTGSRDPRENGPGYIQVEGQEIKEDKKHTKDYHKQ